MRLLLAAPAALLVLAAMPAPPVRSQAVPPAYVPLCELRAKPGNAFTFVPPPSRPPVARPTGRQASNLTAATIAVTYVGFSSAAQAAFQYAVDLWEPLISSSQTIRVEARFEPLGTGVLGSAGANLAWPDFPGASFANTLYGDPLADALYGSDLNSGDPGAYDIVASFNSGFPNWHFASDGTPAPGGKYDFVSVVLHELGHGLEFAGLAFVDTDPVSPTFGEGSIRLGGYVNVYDQFTVDATGAPMLSYTDPSTTLGAALQQPYNPSDPTGPGVYWSGPLGMAANGFEPARLYTPAPWQSGSSYSHLDEAVYPERDPDSLMTPLLSAAETIHDPGPITLGMFADMGWNNFIVNGTFDFGVDPGTGVPLGWLTYAPGQITFAVNNGVFEYTRETPLPGNPTQAVVFQQTGEAVAADTGLYAQFDIGNTGTLKKRISVLMHDQDFSDLSVCTFWMDPGQPLTTYRMYSHTTKVWTGATLSFYIATPGTTDGVYQLDNVSYHSTSSLATTRTDCEDPTAPAAPGGSDGPNLIANGNFSGGLDIGTGNPLNWLTYGTLTWQLASQVFEFIRPTSTPPAGVIFQPTGTAISADEVITAAFDLGNSSSVRKRVTVLLHDQDFSDLTACTFWLAPGQALSTYQIRAFVAGGYPNATLSIYAATVGVHPWIRLDNVVLQRTPGDTPLGTECYEPGDPGPLLRAGGSSSLIASGSSSDGSTDSFTSSRSTTRGALRADETTVWQATAASTGIQTLGWPRVLDLRGTGSARLSFTSWLTASRSSAHVEVSLDGVTWQAVVDVPASAGWVPLDVDLSAFAGQVIRVRLVFDGVAGAGSADRWLVRDVRVTSGEAAR